MRSGGGRPAYTTRLCVSGNLSQADLLKVIFFARSKFTFKKFAQSYALKLLKKTYKIWKNFVKLCQKYEKVTVLQV